jgi:hypothetical protein
MSIHEVRPGARSIMAKDGQKYMSYVLMVTVVLLIYVT